MNYGAYAERVASEVRKGWNDAWDAMVVGKRTFEHKLYMTEKTIYCVKGYHNHPFMISDRTTGMMIPAPTIENAREVFGRIQRGLLDQGWTIMKEAK